MNLENKFTEQLTQLVGPEFESKTYVLAISGGVDSRVLLELFKRQIEVKNFSIAHFNHSIRLESQEEERNIKDWAQAIGCKFNSAKRQLKKTSEEALRNERLLFLESVQKQLNADFIVTAHHLDDQLETFLMRFIRGTGLHGLRGIPQRRAQWLRPLLGVSKNALVTYASKNKLEFFNDHTNELPLYFRNRVRKELVPILYQLSKEYGGREKFLERFKALISEMGTPTSAVPENLSLKKTPLWTSVTGSDFDSLSLDQKKNILRQVAHSVNGKFPDRTQVQSAIQAMGEKKRFHWVGKIEILFSCGYYFFISPENKKSVAQISIETHLGKKSCKGLGLRFPKIPSDFKGSKLRFFKPGDRYRGTKLKKIFLERRIPRPERKLIPVLALGKSSEIIWFLGESGYSPQFDCSPFCFDFLAAPQK